MRGGERGVESDYDFPISANSVSTDCALWKRESGPFSAKVMLVKIGSTMFVHCVVHSVVHETPTRALHVISFFFIVKAQQEMLRPLEILDRYLVLPVYVTRKSQFFVIMRP